MDDRLIKQSKDAGATGVFIPKIDSLELTFIYSDDRLVNQQTNSIWNITGNCTERKLKGKY